MTQNEKNSVKGHARFENGRLITPKKKSYNENIRIVKRVRKSPPILSKKEAKQLRDDLIELMIKITEDDNSDFRKTLVKEIKED